MVLVEVAGNVLRCGRDLDQVSGAPGTTESDGLLAEEQVDVDRLVRLAVPAVLSLRDKPHNRGVALGERGFVREVGRSTRHCNEREHRDEATEQSPAHAGEHSAPATKSRGSPNGYPRRSGAIFGPDWVARHHPGG